MRIRTSTTVVGKRSDLCRLHRFAVTQQHHSRQPPTLPSTSLHAAPRRSPPPPRVMKLIFLAPIPIMLLIYIEADTVLWYYSGFAVPSILMVSVVMPIWAKQPYGMPVHRVRVIQW